MLAKPIRVDNVPRSVGARKSPNDPAKASGSRVTFALPPAARNTLSRNHPRPNQPDRGGDHRNGNQDRVNPKTALVHHPIVGRRKTDAIGAAVGRPTGVLGGASHLRRGPP